MTAYSVPPLRAVGLEGIFGLATTLIGMPILHVLVGAKSAGRGGYFDMRAGWSQIISHATIAWSCVAIAFSIALFNFSGLAVTRSVSATARSVVDTSRSIGIWCFSLLVGWERFRGLQLVGFALLVLGSFTYNEIILFPKSLRRCMGEDRLDEPDCEGRDDLDDDSGTSRAFDVSAGGSNVVSHRADMPRRSSEDTPLLRDE